MNDESDGGVHWSFWAIAAVALLWNVMGSINFIVQMNADSLSAYREAEQAIIEGRPAWATAGFALAVFGGALGSLLLLLRKPIASNLFFVSLLGVIVATLHGLGVVGWASDPGTLIPQLMSLAVAAFLLWYAKYAERKGWTR